MTAETLDGTGGERLVDERSQPCVIGRICEEEDATSGVADERVLLSGLLTQLVEGRGVARVDREAIVAQDGEDVVVAGERPDTGVGPVHGIGLAVAPVEGIRVGSVLDDLRDYRRQRNVRECCLIGSCHFAVDPRFDDARGWGLHASAQRRKS
jgi:hypothetical protein